MAGDPFQYITYTGVYPSAYNYLRNTTYAGAPIVGVYTYKEKEPKEWKLKPHLKFLTPTFKVQINYIAKPMPAINNIPNLARSSC